VCVCVCEREREREREEIVYACVFHCVCVCVYTNRVMNKCVCVCVCVCEREREREREEIVYACVFHCVCVCVCSTFTVRLVWSALCSLSGCQTVDSFHVLSANIVSYCTNCLFTFIFLNFFS